MKQVKDSNGNIIEDIRKTEHGSLVVDNKEEYESYLKHKEQMKKINQNQEDINSIKGDLTDIKNILKELLKDKNNG